MEKKTMSMYGGVNGNSDDWEQDLKGWNVEGYQCMYDLFYGCPIDTRDITGCGLGCVCKKCFDSINERKVRIRSNYDHLLNKSLKIEDDIMRGSKEFMKYYNHVIVKKHKTEKYEDLYESAHILKEMVKYFKTFLRQNDVIYKKIKTVLDKYLNDLHIRQIKYENLYYAIKGEGENIKNIKEKEKEKRLKKKIEQNRQLIEEFYLALDEKFEEHKLKQKEYQKFLNFLMKNETKWFEMAEMAKEKEKEKENSKI